MLNMQPHIRYVDLLGGEQQVPIEGWLQERGKEAMESACQVLTVPGVPFEVEVVSADAPLAIARIALERHCDILLMGTRAWARSRAWH